MERWRGKVAVVTGASAGIGAAIVLELVKHGIKVVGLARRQERVEELKESAKGPGEILAVKCDVSKEEEIVAAFKLIKSKLGTVHILINNAGVIRPGHIADQDPKFIREILDTNVIGLTLCTQQALKLMKESGVNDGHIIHINSIAGHAVVLVGEDQLSSMYSASKFAVTALTETLRQELRFKKSKIKVTSISPGYVETEIVQAAQAALGNASKDNALLNALTAEIPALKASDIADGVAYVLSTGPNVQVHELTIKPVGEPF